MWKWRGQRIDKLSFSNFEYENEVAEMKISSTILTTTYKSSDSKFSNLMYKYQGRVDENLHIALSIIQMNI